MPRICTVCHNPKRAEIEAAVLDGTPYREIARLFCVGHDAVQRHMKSHVMEQDIKQAQITHDTEYAIDVIAQLKTINAVAISIMNAAFADPDKHELALKAIDRVHKQIELQAKLQGDLDERTKINIAIMPEWLAIQKTIMQALQPFSEARTVVSEALAQLE